MCRKCHQQVSLYSPVSAFSPSGEYRFIVETIVPPLPITRKLYRCDKLFATDALWALYETHKQIGIVIVGGDMAEIWIQEHTRYVRVSETSMHRQKAQKKGGQSALRISRLRTEQIDGFVNKVIDMTIRAFPVDKIKDIVVAGHSELFERVAAAPGIAPRVKQIIRSDQLELARITPKITITAGATEAATLAERLFNDLDTDSPLIIYGLDRIKKAIADKIVDKIVITSAIVDEFDTVDAIVELDTTIGTRLHLMGGVLAKTYFPLSDEIA